MVYIAAAILAEGVALFGATVDRPIWFRMPTDDKLITVDGDRIKLFYHDCDKNLAEATAKVLNHTASQHWEAS